jgi:very-short-patch-repair endonuclease
MSSLSREGERVHPVNALTRLGGVADRKTLLALTSRRRLRTALSRGEIIRVGDRGFALVTAQVGLRAARSLNGVASHENAAIYHAWEIKLEPERPSVIVPRHRTVPAHKRRGIDVRFRDLQSHEHDGLATSKARTVIDCAKDLPFDRALAVADSALRHGDVTQEELIRLALRVPSNGRKQALRVAAAADGRAANPFESALRAIALDVPGLAVEPQVTITEHGWAGRPDLVDAARRLVIEADSFEFHSTRRALRRDVERYTNLVVRGWTVVRFTWEHVMFEPEYVRACLVALVDGPGSLATLNAGTPISA